MDAIYNEIDGSEATAGDGSAMDALVEFYRAFNGGDTLGLQANWIEGEAASMDNPIGGIRRGWDSIGEAYSKLFGGSAKVFVTFHDFTSQGDTNWHLFVGRERGICKTPSETLDLAFRTTRWFIKTSAGWRQLHHHGSVEDPKLLADYQRIIFGKTS